MVNVQCRPFGVRKYRKTGPGEGAGVPREIYKGLTFADTVSTKV
jgi:hypothetical protein